eukprot:5150100-Prymnesium_polylepis.1
MGWGWCRSSRDSQTPTWFQHPSLTGMLWAALPPTVQTSQHYMHDPPYAHNTIDHKHQQATRMSMTM